MKNEVKTGTVLAWIVVDGRTGEPVMRCATRAEARKSVKGTGGRVCKLEVIR